MQPKISHSSVLMMSFMRGEKCWNCKKTTYAVFRRLEILTLAGSKRPWYFGGAPLCVNSLLTGSSSHEKVSYLFISNLIIKSFLFQSRTLKIIENGLMHRYISIHDSHTKITCDQNKGGQRKWRINQAVTLRQCTVAFSFCLAGACLSIVILYGEKLFAKREICKD